MVYNAVFGFQTPAGIGARGNNLQNSFFGAVDELSVYQRPLNGSEIQAIYNAGSAGKCKLANCQQDYGNTNLKIALYLGRYAGLQLDAAVGIKCQVQYVNALANANSWVTLTNFTLPARPYLFIDTSSSATARYSRTIFSP